MRNIRNEDQKTKNKKDQKLIKKNHFLFHMFNISKSKRKKKKKIISKIKKKEILIAKRFYNNNIIFERFKRAKRDY